VSNREEPYKVKFIPYRKNLGDIMFRQTAGGKGLSSDGRYRFYINEDIKDPDFLVVQGKGVREPLSCKVAPLNTLLLTTEPRSVLVYPKKYLNQFGMVCSCQEGTIHPNLILGPAILPWFVGYTETKDGSCSYSLDYDNLIKAPTPPKTKLISVITSNKAFTQGHLDRINFVEKLKAKYGDKIDIFGRGYNDFDDKWDVLAPYKYHIVIENSSQSYYWTEKISDCYLAETFPFYYGCTNLSDYFPEDSFQPINIHNFEQATSIIDRLISEDIYESKKSILAECKADVLGKYNMFNYVANLCDRLNPPLPKTDIILEPCHSMEDWHNFFNYTFTRNYLKLKQKISGIFNHSSLG